MSDRAAVLVSIAMVASVVVSLANNGAFEVVRAIKMRAAATTAREVETKTAEWSVSFERVDR